VDYLVKPITEERFQEAVTKVERLHASSDAPGPVQPPNHVFLKQDNRLVKVPFDDILYVEALKDFSKVYGRKSRCL
jgi:DNA-binding LytR/AlgR family response regulator